MAYDCHPVDLPGIYQLRADNKLIDLFPANVSPTEGDLTAVEIDRAAKNLGVKKYSIIPYNRPSQSIVTEARYGRELWKIFLWAAAILLAVEMIFSREKEVESEVK